MNFSKHITGKTSAAPLAIFRIIFGGIMLASIIRFWLKGWIDQQYIQPKFFFKYFGFEWVQPLNESGMYLLFFLMGLSALFIMLGLFYRVATITFFLTFTYVELIDLTNYLNHYYFVSIVAMLLIFLPANRYFSLDVWRTPSLYVPEVPAWTINAIKLQLGIVYFYAGLAKLNPDWLFEAQPLRLWLIARADLPIIGFLFDYIWVAFFFSWFGAIYDLTIPFFLLNRKTRPLAYVAVVAFHVLTAILFPIGMFPYIMILSTLIFFPAQFHQKIITLLKRLVNQTSTQEKSTYLTEDFKPAYSKFIIGLLAIHFTIQILFPFRYILYPGNLFWTEQGFRFSWRVMLMEKAGAITFMVKNPETGHYIEINNQKYLTPLQEKMMATQPDMILQFAHFLKDEHEKLGIKNPEVYAQSYVTLNGRPSRQYIDPSVDLTKLQDSFTHKAWLLPFENKPIYYSEGR